MKRAFKILVAIVCTTNCIAQNKKYTQKLSYSTSQVFKALENDSTFKTGIYELRYNNRLQVNGNYSQNLKHGKWEVLYPSGQKKIKGNFINNRMHGVWTSYYSTTGKIKAKCYFNLGKRVNTWQGYFSNGELATEQLYKNDTLIKAVFYNENTGKISEQFYYNYKNGNQFTTEKLYHPKKGNIYKEAYYTNNQPDSIYKTYHENRAPWEDFEYEKGLLLEVNSIRNPAGEKMQKGNFYGGDGLAHFYDYDGFLYAKINYSKGLKNGIARYYQRDNLMSEGKYQEGIRVGVWKFYSEYGKLLEEINYLTKEDAQQIVYGNAWNEREHGPLKNGLKHGLWKKNNFYGDLEAEVNFQFGYKHGLAKTYHPIVIKSLGYYEYGEKVGKWEYFNNSGKLVYTENFPLQVSVDTTLVSPSNADPLFQKFTRYENQKVFKEATFIGGSSNEAEFINSNMRYSNVAVAKQIHGTVELQFLVHPTGEIDQIKIIKGIGYGLDEEAIRLFKAMPWWNPAEENGIPIRSLVFRSVEF